MAKELVVGIAIGAALQGFYLAAFGNAKRTRWTRWAPLPTSSSSSTLTQMGEAMQRSMGRLSGGTLAAINRDYEKLGRTIDALTGSPGREHGQGCFKCPAGTLGRREEVPPRRSPSVRHFLRRSNRPRADPDLRDIAITGNLKARDEIALGATLRESALRTNQGHAAIMLGVNTLVAAGMEAQTRRAIFNLARQNGHRHQCGHEDLAGMVYAFSETLGIKGEQAIEAFSRAAFGGKLGTSS